jgi:two-component system cell cycle response regulator
LRKILIPGMILYTVAAGLGLFLRPDPSSHLLIPWIAGYFFLALTLSYKALFDKKHSAELYFFILAVIGINFLIQITGGEHSPVFPFYFILASAAAMRHRNQAYTVGVLILTLEAFNLLAAGKGSRGEWYQFAGFAASLSGLTIITSSITKRIRSQAKEAKDSYAKLISDAEAVDPLAGGSKVEALTEKRRKATHINVVREREGAFSELIDLISGIVPAHTYALFLDDREEGVFTLRAIRSGSRSVLSTALGFSMGKGLIGICAGQNKPQYQPRLAIPSVSLGYYSQEVPVKSFLAMPIVQGERLAGVLAVDSLEHDAFPLETQETLRRFIPFFSHMIEKIRISLEMDIRAKSFAALHEMSSVLNSSLDLSEVLDNLLIQIRLVVPYDFCIFLLHDEKTGLATVAALKGYDSRMSGISFPLAESAVLTHMMCEWNSRRVVSIHHAPDLGNRGRDIGLFPLKELQQPLMSLFGRPLVAQDKFIGAAFLGSIRSHVFTEYHRNLMDMLLNQVSMFVNNSILHRRIHDMARTDGLTGLLNHRTFVEKLTEEYRRLDRESRPFSILLMDIDRFKSVNDKYGHPVGDAAIKTVAKVMKETVRGSDFVARYGGEEFAVGMVETDSQGALQMGERIRKILGETVVTRVSDGELRITVSIGVSSFPGDTKNVTELVAMADKALYEAKRSGRNRVCLYRDNDKRETAALQKTR